MISLGEDFLNSSELKRLVRKKQEAIDTMTKEVDYKKSLMLDRVKWDTVQITGRKVTIDPCRLNIIVPYDSFPLIRVYRVIGKDMGRIEEAFVACM